MDEIERAGFGLMGLHRLVAGRGDGLVPELYEALMREALWRAENPNVVRFPAAAARRPCNSDDGAIVALDGKVLAFASSVVENRAQRKAE